jgi:hypothetical protein
MKTLAAILSCFAMSLACFAQMQDLKWGEEFNSSGATLLLKEVGRARANGQTVVTYRLFETGLPRDSEYKLWMKLVGKEPQAVADAFINKDGMVVNSLADPSHKVSEDPINLKVVAGRGEPKEFGLLANDGDHRAFGQAVPFPIEISAGACHVSAIMTAQNFSGVLFVVTGLHPGEEFQINQQSGSESLQPRLPRLKTGRTEC